uniref:Uncharacterized protein n=1 Tax=Calidris pygmaea TaxID=425635 RepID=A0A8C3JHD3_9CHAR
KRWHGYFGFSCTMPQWQSRTFCSNYRKSLPLLPSFEVVNGEILTHSKTHSTNYSPGSTEYQCKELSGIRT